MLTDHRTEVERRAYDRRTRQELPKAFGNFIAGLAAWHWFVNPITFRDPALAAATPSVDRNASGRMCPPDPRLQTWSPSRGHFVGGPPRPDYALPRIFAYLDELEAAAGQPIGFVIGEEFGSIGGRYHCHALISGVDHLRRDVWWERAFKLFGRTRIEPFDPARAAAHYTAKYAAKQLGGLHFGGTLQNVDLKALDAREPARGGGIDVARSADVPSSLFHMTLGRWHK